MTWLRENRAKILVDLGRRESRRGDWVSNLEVKFPNIVCIAAIIFLGICLSQAATISGTAHLNTDGKGEQGEAGKYPIAAKDRLTLCSADHVYITNTDAQGAFVFLSVQAGSYDFAGRRKDIFSASGSMRTLRVEETDKVAGWQVLIGYGPNMSPCGVSTEGHNQLRDFRVYYEPQNADNTGPMLIGKVLKHGKPRHGELDRSAPIAKAEIQLLPGDKDVSVAKLKSGRDGSFQFRPRPGLYRLIMKVPGFYDIVVPKFLVTSKDVTKIELITAKEGSIIIDL